MKCSAALKVCGDSDKLYQYFSFEQSKADRSIIKVAKEKDHILINIEATDATALRAALNTVMSAILVLEKMGET